MREPRSTAAGTLLMSMAASAPIAAVDTLPARSTSAAGYDQTRASVASAVAIRKTPSRLVASAPLRRCTTAPRRWWGVEWSCETR